MIYPSARLKVYYRGRRDRLSRYNYTKQINENYDYENCSASLMQGSDAAAVFSMLVEV